MTTILAVSTHDLRARTSAFLHGSDADHPDPDYSAAHVVLHTDGEHEGHGMTFTIGKGNELCCAAIEALTSIASCWPAGTRCSIAAAKPCSRVVPNSASA